MTKALRTYTNQRFAWIATAILVALVVIFLYNFLPIGQRQQPAAAQIEITSRASLIHVGSNDSFATTQEGIQAARLLYDAIKNQKPTSAKEAIALYDRIIPRENYGGEYTALQWFGQLSLMSETERQQQLKDPYVASFYEFFAGNDYAQLKEYMERKYTLAEVADASTEAGQNRKIFLEDFILFNNPRREEWEKTSKIINAIKIKPGQTIADIGSGPGYYTFKFAQQVGQKGKVYAIDTVQTHLDYVKGISDKYGVTNVQPINSDPGTTIGLSTTQKVDLAFMCSLYHNIYAMATEDNRNTFVESIVSALKPGGRLVVVDNAFVKPGQLPYHGPFIAKELITGQFKYHGLRLVEEHQFIPQRYVLVFEKA